MASVDALFGTWKQDLGRSLYSPGPNADSHMRVYEKAGEGFKVTCNETIGGKTISWNYTSPAYDGKPYPVLWEETISMKSEAIS